MLVVCVDVGLSGLKLNNLYEVVSIYNTPIGTSYYDLIDSNGKTFYRYSSIFFKYLSEIRLNKLKKIC